MYRVDRMLFTLIESSHLCRYAYNIQHQQLCNPSTRGMTPDEGQSFTPHRALAAPLIGAVKGTQGTPLDLANGSVPEFANEVMSTPEPLADRVAVQGSPACASLNQPSPSISPLRAQLSSRKLPAPVQSRRGRKGLACIPTP